MTRRVQTGRRPAVGEARPPATVPSIQAALDRLTHAVEAGHNRTRCLRRWSEFVRERDDQRCVDCHSSHRLSAHHICRKTFLPEAELMTGNGITLCLGWHADVHRGFTGRPDMTEPMDAQGGEKLATMERLYGILDQDAAERGIQVPAFYHLSESVLGRFKRLQGFPASTAFPGPPVRQAYLIWAQTSMAVRDAVARANGFALPPAPLLPGDAVVRYEDADGRQGQVQWLRNPLWR